MNIQEINNYLSTQNADFEILVHDKPIKSKNDAKGCFRIEETAPTLIIRTEKGFYAIIVSGEKDKIDLENIKGILSARKICFASKDELLSYLNMEPGKVSLVGHKLPCIIDNSILKYDYVYGGIGDFYQTLKINPKDLIRVNNVIATFD